MLRTILILLLVFSPLIAVVVICVVQAVPWRKLLVIRATKAGAIAMGLHLFVTLLLIADHMPHSQPPYTPTPIKDALVIAVAYPALFLVPVLPRGGSGELLVILTANIGWGIATAIVTSLVGPMIAQLRDTHQFSLRHALAVMTAVSLVAAIVVALARNMRHF
jgi:hypothetical protein